MCDRCGKGILDYVRRTIYFSTIDNVFDSKMVHKTLKQPTDVLDDAIDAVSMTVDGKVTSGSFSTSAYKVSYKTYKRMKGLIYLASSWVYDMMIYPKWKDQLPTMTWMKICPCEFYSAVFTIIAEQIYCIWYKGGFSSYTLLTDVVAVFGAGWIDEMLIKRFPNVPLISDTPLYTTRPANQKASVPMNVREGQGEQVETREGIIVATTRNQGNLIMGKAVI